MKVIIAGSRPPKETRRSIPVLNAWYEAHELAVDLAVTMSTFIITEVVSGGAAGFDTLGERWARTNGIPVTPMLAIWRDAKWVYNPRAGFERNARMADYADALIALWDYKSGGTLDMITQMINRNKPRFVQRIAA